RSTETDLLGRVPSESHLSAAADGGPCRPGLIYLVGLGPGDTELVTLKAARLLKDAHRVYCFDFLREEVARFARPEALTVVPPLLMGRHVLPGAEGSTPDTRERVGQAVLARAEFVSQVREMVNAGRTVVFADSGDPTLFSPWFWIERAFADLLIEVVPGISSFNAANAL